MLRHVSFDFDGVLAQGSNEAYIDSYHRAVLQVGVELDPQLERERILASWGLPVREQVAVILAEYPDKVDAATKIFLEARRSPAFLAQVSLFPGADDTLKKLHSQYALSIVSGADRKLIESVLGSELLALFVGVYSASDYPPHQQKPSPYMLQQAMLGLGATPNETVYIGDAPNDLRMAVAANVAPIAVLTGHLTRSQAAELGAHHILEDITELPGTLTTFAS